MKLLSLMTLFIIFCLSGCGSSKYSYTKPDAPEIKKDPRCISGNCITGIGYFLDNSGNSYEGNFSGMYRQGFGTYTLSNGKQFQGIWHQNDLNGACKIRLKNGPWEEGTCTDINNTISFQKKPETKPIETKPKKPTDAELKRQAYEILERIQKRKN